MSSSQVWPRNEFIFSGRLIVIQATPLRTSYRMSSNSIIISLLAWSAVHRQTTRDAQHLAGDKARVVAGKEGDGAGYVVRLAQAAQRDRPGEGFQIGKAPRREWG